MRTQHTNHGAFLGATQPDPYAALKKAHAEGKVIECIAGTDRQWMAVQGEPRWFLPVEDYRIKPEPEPAFQLPPPPPGMQWHRTDGWKEGDLPQGWRPLALEECEGEGDEEWNDYGKQWMECYYPFVPAFKYHQHTRTRRPLTFTHAGKTWTWHRPGDPMPCDGERALQILLSNGEPNRDLAQAKFWDWESEDKESDVEIIGWRYADEKKTVPLGPEDVLPGSVIRSDSWTYGGHVTPSVFLGVVCWANTSGNVYLTYEQLAKQGWQINRSLSKGQWNPDAWEPCSKEVLA